MANVHAVFKMLPYDVMDEFDDFETPLDDAPLVSPYPEGINMDLSVGLREKRNDPSLIRANDDALVEWAGRWSLDHITQHRKFHIVHGIMSKSKTEELKAKWGMRWRHVSKMKFE